MRTESYEKRSIVTWLFNPFKYVAGAQSLIIGIIVIAITAYIGSFSTTHFDGVLDTHTGVEAPLWCYFAEGVISWLSMVVFLLVIGKIASSSSFRIIDLLGTQAMARWPMLLTSMVFLAVGFERFTHYLMWYFLRAGEAAPFVMRDMMVFITVVVVMLTASCWMVYLMYRSYSISCNLKGGKAVATFVIGLLIAEIVSKILIGPMLARVVYDHSWKPVAHPPPQNEVMNHEYAHTRHLTFEDDADIEIINRDKGLNASIENGEFRIYGITTDSEWKADAMKTHFVDNGGPLDISGAFRIENETANGLVFLGLSTEHGGSLILMYQWSGLVRLYQIQTRWYKIPATLLNDRTKLRARGNENETFNTLRIHIRPDRQHADFYVNDDYYDTVAFEESFGKVRSAKLELQSPREGAEFDIRFDDLIIRSETSLEEPQAAEPNNQTSENSPRSVEQLIQDLSSSDGAVRYQASIALADIGPPARAAVPALTEAVRDLKVCAGAALALGYIGVSNGDVTTVLLEALTHTNFKWDRCQAAMALARLNVQSAIPNIEKLKDDPDPDVRHHADLALEMLRKKRDEQESAMVEPRFNTEKAE